MSYNTVLTNIKELDFNNIIFSKVSTNQIPKSNLTYKRINISVKNPDGTIGDLVISSEPRIFSFGVSENISMDGGKPNGYTFPLCLWDKDNPTEEQKIWTKKYEDMVEYIKTYLVEHREDFEKYELDKSELKKFGSFYWKTDKGKSFITEEVERQPIVALAFLCKILSY
jgi:hypothetical protein